MKKAALFSIIAVLLAVSVQAKSPKKYCLGAVGKQCAVPGSVKGTPSPLNMVACSKVEKGQTNCWVSPGSIEHDNCCLKHPGGVMCASETKNDGNCAKEWEDACKDISQKMAWYHIFNVKKFANMAVVPSKRMKRFGGQESQSTADLCAPGGTKLLVRYDSGFCCAGKAKKQKDVMICSEESRSQITAKAKRPEQKEQIAMKPQTIPPPLPQLPEQYRKAPQPQSQPQPVVSRPIGTQTAFDYGRGPNMPPPQPMQEEQDELEQPTYYEVPQSPPEPVEEARPSCPGGSWSPTLGTCVEDQQQESAAPPDCGAGAHWSPTLKSCQAD